MATSEMNYIEFNWNNAKCYTIDVTNYSVSSPWGNIYTSPLLDTQIPFDSTKQGAQITFVATNGSAPTYTFTQNGVLMVGFVRGTVGDINGKLDILVYDII